MVSFKGITNPGDHTSRGLLAGGLLSCDKWLMGPEFLWKSECQWPTQSLDTSNAIQHNDPEVKPDPKVNSHAISLGAPIVSPTVSLSDRFDRFSSWYRLKKTVARIFRFRNNKFYLTLKFSKSDFVLIRQLLFSRFYNNHCQGFHSRN